MNMENMFDWVEFYKALAQELLRFKNDRKTLVSYVKKVYEITEINLPTLEKDNQIVDIDPFTFYGLFNKNKIKESNRIKIIEAIAELLNVSAPIPTSFASIPVLNNQNATFYYFLPGRGENDIQDLWDLFSTALAYAENTTPENRAALTKYFDTTINKKGNGNSKITMGLYWIAPDFYMNLDQKNTWYIYESGKMPETLVNTLPEIEAKIPAAKYFEIVDKLHDYIRSPECSLKDFKELSYSAWSYADQVNKELAAAKESEKTRGSQGAAMADEDVDTIHYWVYAPGDGAMYWDEFYNAGIMGIGWDKIGDLSEFDSKDEMKQAMKDKIDPSKPYKNAAHATWQFAKEMKPGDIIYAKKGMHLVIGRGVVESDYEFDPDRKTYKNTRKVNWTNKGEWSYPGQAAMKTLTDITSVPDLVEKMKSLFESEDINDIDEPSETKLIPYDEDQFLEQVYMDKPHYDSLVALLMKKKNVILQGAPGVGKTFAAKRLAYSIMGVKDPERVMMVQFHQSYSYEDFIMGFRPTEEGGFELKKGAFYDFCKSAAEDSEDTPYFFIIDEINRGNLSKIFGELFMLIEEDKRGVELRLLYKKENFSVPKNVYIIGMMNTADRSLAMMDYALRRRFAFFDMEPGFDTKGFQKYQSELNSDKFNKLIERITALNYDIAEDDSLGEGFCIGHSYFCGLKETSQQTLSGIINFEIAPLLKEYWFDEKSKANDWIDDLRSAIQ